MKKYRLQLLALAIAAVFVGCNSSSTDNNDGWQNLINENMEGWTRVAGAAEFTNEDGVIIGTAVANTPNTFLITDQEYTDFILELEIKVDHESSNSGVMVRGQYDPQGKEGKGRVYGYQVELDPKERAWSAGIYDEARRGWLYPLTLNPEARTAYKSNEFNAYRIEVIGNEIKTWLNGQEVAYLVDDTDAKGMIGLQVHGISNPEDAGHKTYFRNIRIKTENLDPLPFKEGIFVVNNLDNELTAYEEENGWKLLFDGSSSDGWRGAKRADFPEAGWTINEGVLTIE